MFPQKLTANFSQAACRELARAASIAYHDEVEIKNVASAVGALSCDYILNRETNLHCFIAATHEDVVVSFKGTDPGSLKNWITDAQFLKSTWHGMKVHRGFASAYDSIRRDLFVVVERLTSNPPVGGYNFWITGHSLGGALAALCALDIEYYGNYIAGVYTFGQPRVGNAEFALNYDLRLRAKTFRMVHEEDIVPRLPGPILARYHHCGREIFLNEFGSVNVDPKWYVKLSSDVAGLWGECYSGSYLKAIDQLLTDHSMDRYLERVNS